MSWPNRSVCLARSVSLFSSFLPLLLAVSAVLSATASIAADGTKFEIEFFEEGSPAPMNHATVWVSARRIRVEQHGPGEPIGPVLIYRGDQDRILSVSDASRSYAQIERQILTLLAGETRRVRRELEGHLQGLPADQQKAFDRLLGISRQDPKMAQNPVRVKQAEGPAREGEVAGFRCTHVEMKRSDFVVGEACVASWEGVGMTPADLEVFRALAHFQRDAMGSRALSPMELVPDQPLDLIAQFGGLPLSYVRRVDGRDHSSIRVVSVEHIRAADSYFEVPVGYALEAGHGAFAQHLAPGRGVERSARQTRASVPAAPAPASGPMRATASPSPTESAPRGRSAVDATEAPADGGKGKRYVPSGKRRKATRKPETRLIRLF